ncbi:MAG: SDR family NAD(P)-dependent oxidoreductase [Planctomycetota bacterium]|jgi:3-oxoacyl-[acyl-carrier protein] reductase
MDLGLNGMVVLVTGASGGIGRALVSGFGAEGATLVCHTLRQEAELSRWLDAQPFRERACVVRADVRSMRDMDAVVETTLDRFGRMDICVANAGKRPPSEGRLDKVGEERIRETIDVNLLGGLWTARALFRALERAGPRPDGRGSSLLLIGSTAASFGERGYADYAAAKAGLEGLAMTLKNEIASLDPLGRVNLLEPGWTATHVPRPALEDLDALRRTVRTMPLRQIAEAEDIARAALWLSSPLAARHVSGQILRVAGGMEGRILWEPEDVDPGEIRRKAGESR